MSVFVFDGYTHSEDEVGIRIDRKTVFSRYRQPLIGIEKWMIVGAIRGDGSSGSLSASIGAIEDLYTPGRSSYSTATFTANGNVHTFDPSGTYSGIQVRTFGWMKGPWKMRTEMSNRRAFYAVIQAEYRLSAEVLAYREEVRRFGTGGSKWRFMPSLTGLPLRQTLQTYTPVRYVQRGQLVTKTNKPAANSPLFDWVDVHEDLVQVTEFAPKVLSVYNGIQSEEVHGVEWMYPAEYSVQQGSYVTFQTPAL